MLARCSLLQCTARRSCCFSVRSHTSAWGSRTLRLHSTGPYPSAAPGSLPSPSPLAVLASLTNELDRISPRFEINASQISILKDPSEFYETLKSKILNAKRRIYLSTLYIGKTEEELVTTIGQALRDNPNLNLSILTDALRGTRETPEPSCASLIVPLVGEFGPERVELRMFHTPNLSGIRKKVVPNRINEGWGLQHMKLYGIDDEIIISGANLSNDYFSNRQDRYHVFHSQELTKYYSLIHDAVSSISFLIHPDSQSGPNAYRLIWPESNRCSSPLDDPRAYIEHAKSILKSLIRPSAKMAPSSGASDTADTYVYPLFQLTPLLSPAQKTDASTELPVIKTILSALSPDGDPTSALQKATWTFTAGYFNMTPTIRDLLLASRPPTATVIAASPQANGFYGSKGISGMLPAAYTLLEKRFLQATQNAGLGEQIKIMEWRRGTVNEPGGWTYHAKGIWITLAGERPTARTTPASENGRNEAIRDEERRGPSISLVGSSNYTARSYSLDLEANALIVTRNPDLMKRLAEEELWLQEFARPIGEEEFIKTERRVGLHVRLAMWIVRVVGGAL